MIDKRFFYFSTSHIENSIFFNLSDPNYWQGLEGHAGLFQVLLNASRRQLESIEWLLPVGCQCPLALFVVVS